MPEPTSTTPPLPPELPVLPLRGTVAFPLSVQPLAVNRPVSVESVNRALAGDRMLLLVLQEGELDDPDPEQVKRIGTVGIIRQMARNPSGLHVIVEGLARVRADVVSRTGLSMRAVIHAEPEQVDRSVEVDAYVRRLQEQVDRALTLASGFSQELRGIVAAIEDPLRLAYLLGSLLDMPADDKQQLLEADTLLSKLGMVSQALAREIALLEVKGKIESQAQQEMSDAQRQVLPAPAAQSHSGRARRGRG